MDKIDLAQHAKNLSSAWRSVIVGRAAGANVKVLRMDESAYLNEVHDFAEGLLVLEGLMNLHIAGANVSVRAGELFIVPAGTPHAVAPGSQGILVIVDQ